MDLTAALRYLDEHVNLEATAGRVEGLSLERMRALVHVLGDPHLAYGVIHITGTNGKGSTARMVTELLRASGLAVGTYTSPHLETVNERIAYDGEPIADDELAELISDLAAVEPLLEHRPSYFELLTAAAFRWFADRGVDVAVVEVGLLGRWDATNVVESQVAVLTNVGHDHTDGVGDWRRRIAEEKSGIVKPGATFVLGEADPALRDVFTATPAAEIWLRGDTFGCERNDLAVGGRVADLRTPSGVLDDVQIPLHGAFQGDNAAAALAAAEAFFGRRLPDDLVRSAFAGVQVPGRFEILAHEPLVILDGAHNLDGAAAEAATLHEEFTLTGSLVLVVGMLRGRDPVEMLDAMGAREAGYVVACSPPSPRAIPAAEVAAAADRLGVVAEAVPDVAHALARARSFATAEDVIVVTGSLYVVGAARRSLHDQAAELAG
ncbi:MAG TPA: Mur ligase family protein [Acidimicrobiales bacterium]|jgi:dihydrofolate synthase/folylpolyglutamate synthase|nr:Mur ligase family protein [Acidimicrobiales bacterium]